MTAPACREDRECYRSAGHDGDHAYPDGCCGCTEYPTWECACRCHRHGPDDVAARLREVQK